MACMPDVAMSAGRASVILTAPLAESYEPIAGSVGSPIVNAILCMIASTVVGVVCELDIPARISKG
jgi:hypothetical protein